MSGFQVALDKWKDFALTVKQKELDEKSLEILENQRIILASKKKLVEDTRDFKKKDLESRNDSLPELLKNYQTEIDNIAKRCKFAETLFLHLYRDLVQLPDPYPFLSSALDFTSKTLDLQSENENLKKQIETLKSSLSNNGGQLQQKQESGVSSPAPSQGEGSAVIEAKKLADSAFAEREKELQIKYQEKFSLLQDAQRDLQLQMVSAKEQTDLLKSTFVEEKRVLSERITSISKELEAKNAELDIVLSDLHRSKLENVTLEQGIKALKLNLEKQTSPTSPSSADDSINLIKNNKQLEQSLVLAKSDLAALHYKIEGLTGQLEDLNSQLSEKEKQLEDLKTERQSNSKAMSVLKDELDAFKAVELGIPSDSQSPTLNSSLIKQNRTLRSEITELRFKYDETRKAFETLQAEKSKLVDDLTKQGSLVKKLEEDLYSNKQNEPSGHSESTSPDVGNASVNGAGNNISAIISSQRDRFRKRCDELESQLRSHQNSQSQMTFELERLKKDNLELYGKIRYMSSYNNNNNNNNLNANGTTSLIDHRYRDLYEEEMDPFKRFHQKEDRRRIQNMNPFDRITYTITKLILGSSATRKIMLIYLISLHSLVFIVLSKWATHKPAVNRK